MNGGTLLNSYVIKLLLRGTELRELGNFVLKGFSKELENHTSTEKFPTFHSIYMNYTY